MTNATPVDAQRLLEQAFGASIAALALIGTALAGGTTFTSTQCVVGSSTTSFAFAWRSGPAPTSYAVLDQTTGAQ